MKRAPFLAVLALASAAAAGALPEPPIPGELRVLVQVTDAAGKKAPAPGAVVWIPGSSDPERRPSKPPRVASKKKRFDPRVLAVPVGTTVEFPNFDRIFHNVFSLSSTASFDLGLYRNGDFRPYTFRSPGLVKVYCNIHPQMAAFVMVVDGDVLAVSDGDGIARLVRVEPGRQRLRVWEERGGETEATAEVTAGAVSTVTVVLDASRFRETPHRNKHGKEYPPPEDDEARY